MCKHKVLYLNDGLQDTAEVLKFTFHLYTDSFIYFVKTVNFEVSDLKLIRAEAQIDWMISPFSKGMHGFNVHICFYTELQRLAFFPKVFFKKATTKYLCCVLTSFVVFYRRCCFNHENMKVFFFIVLLLYSDILFCHLQYCQMIHVHFDFTSLRFQSRFAGIFM